MSILAINSFPIIAPLAVDAAQARAATAQAFQQRPDAHARTAHEQPFDTSQRHASPAPPRTARPHDGAPLLDALIAQMGGGPMPSGKGVYIDVRV